MSEKMMENRRDRGPRYQTRREFLKLAGLTLGGLAVSSYGLSKIGGTDALFSDTEDSHGNMFVGAWGGTNLWLQTELDDYATGLRYLVNLFNPAGDVWLLPVSAMPSREEPVTSGDMISKAASGTRHRVRRAV
jgi:hypothetical protein